VSFEVQQPLHDLMKQFEPSVRILNQNDRASAFDFHCPLMSLPLAFRTTLPIIPSQARYLASSPSLRSAWTTRLGTKDRPRVGIAWSGVQRTRTTSGVR